MFGSVEFPKRTKQEAPLFQQGQAMEREATGFASGIRALVSDVTDTSDERIRAGRTANANSWQADAAARDFDSTRPGISAFARAMGANKARTRIASAGDNAVELQALRNRAAISKVGGSIRSGNTRDMSNLMRAQDEFNAMKMQAEQTRAAGISGLVGTLSGYGMGAAKQGFQNYSATSGLSDISVTARPVYQNLSDPGLYQV